MKKSSIVAERLAQINARLGDATIDPAVWPEIMQQIATAVGATGAALLQSDIRTFDVPRTAGVEDALSCYFAGGWHTRDIRADRCVPLLLSSEKVVTDQDILTREEIERSELYAETLRPYGLQWFAVIGFWSGPALWTLSIQRSKREGPFEASDKNALAILSRRLTETASLSKAVGRAVLSNVTNAFNLIEQPTVAIDRFGFVININEAAERMFDNEIRVRDRRLFVRDDRAKSALELLMDQVRKTSDTVALPLAPIVVRREDKRPVVIRALPINGAASTPFLGARVLLVLYNLSKDSRPEPSLLSKVFGLSPAEAKLASLLASGISPERAAEKLGVARETARNQLKAIFFKTATHRQGELIALLSRLQDL